MNIPKKTRRYCPYCNKHTEQKISMISSGHKRGSLKKGSLARAKKRNVGVGKGNLGKWGSKPAVTAWKRKTKSTKKTNFMFTCETCKKSTLQRKGTRAGKVQFKKE